jgi:hypothetical protein
MFDFILFVAGMSVMFVFGTWGWYVFDIPDEDWED